MTTDELPDTENMTTIAEYYETAKMMFKQLNVNVAATPFAETLFYMGADAILNILRTLDKMPDSGSYKQQVFDALFDEMHAYNPHSEPIKKG